MFPCLGQSTITPNLDHRRPTSTCHVSFRRVSVGQRTRSLGSVQTQTVVHRPAHRGYAIIIAVIYIMVKEWVNPKCNHPSSLTKLMLHLEQYMDLCLPYSFSNQLSSLLWNFVFIVTFDLKYVFFVYTSPKMYSRVS